MESCPVCGGPVSLVAEERDYRVGRLATKVADEFYRCAECGEAVYTPEQAQAVEAQAVAKLHAAGRLLLPAEIRAIRERYRLTQAEFERLLGTGPNTVVRWEAGQVIPNAATEALLRLVAADPKNAERLAVWHGVELRGAA